MGGSSAASWIAVFTSFCAGSLLIPALFKAMRRRYTMAKSQSRACGETALAGPILRRGMPWCKPVARIVLKVPRAGRVFREASDVLGLRGLPTSEENLCTVWCTLILAAAVLGTMLGASPIFGIAFSACLCVGAWFFVERGRDVRLQHVREEVPDVLHAMESCFFAGLSLLQTFQHIAEETRGPLKEMFSQAARELELGMTPDEALGAFRNNAAIPELSFIAIALEVQHDAGGSMGQILATARDSVKSDLELRRSLRVQTAQAKLSARVVTALPFVLMALFSLITENFLAPFFSSAAGLALLFVAVSMQTAGILAVRTLLKVGID